MNVRQTGEQWDDVPAKVVGRRTMGRGSLSATASLLELALAIRRGKPYVPRGVYRFKTFEEADAWTMRMITRR